MYCGEMDDDIEDAFQFDSSDLYSTVRWLSKLDNYELCSTDFSYILICTYM